MEELGLSLMFHTEQSLKTIESLLQEFESETRIHVNLTVLDWATGHSQLVREALYNRGPDVSEIGSTWTSDLVAMNALRPFSPQDLHQIGNPQEFVSASWKTGLIEGDERVWAIPYTANLYLIYYRKDLLRKAGLDEQTAFRSHAAIDETVGRLRRDGLDIPLLLPDDPHALLHSLASWIWAGGADFCSPDGKQVLFDRPESLAAMRAYFGLLRHLAPEALKKVDGARSIDLFCQGASAIHFHDLAMAPEEQMAPQVLENLGVAPFPEPYFMGGTNLVTWQHSSRTPAAVSLVKFLTSVPTMARLVVPFRMLPPRSAVMELPGLQQGPFLNRLGPVAAGGRSYPVVRLWGVIEDRLINALLGIRTAALADPQLDLDELISQKITPLADKLNVVLSS